MTSTNRDMTGCSVLHWSGTGETSASCSIGKALLGGLVSRQGRSTVSRASVLGSGPAIDRDRSHGGDAVGG